VNRVQALTVACWSETKRILLGRPHSAELDVTDNCNLHCSHCYHFANRPRKKVPEVPLSQWRHRLAFLHQQGIRFLLLVGGEPALRPDVLALATKRFPFVYAITNGTLPIDRALPLRLFVSLDGGPRTNDAMRGAGVYERVIDNVTGDGRVVFNMVLTAENYTELAEVARTSEGLGLRGVVCNLYTPTLAEVSPYRISNSQRVAIVAELRRVKQRWPKSLLLSPAMIDWYARADHSERCYWGDQALHFDTHFRSRRCFTDADCSNCGCLGGAFQSPRHIARHPLEMLALM
jgi:MoaA/NifB/PqqE/SkfB family radical SAM enzyme